MKFNQLTRVCLVAAAACIAPTIAHAATASHSDREFIREAGYGGNDEIALSKVAEKRSNDPAIRQFARRMIVQHSAAGAQLKQIASSLGVRVPGGPDAKHAILKLELEVLNGSRFNHTYINDMVKDHIAADHVFQMGATVTNDELRSFAVSTLPTIENHLKMAVNFQQELKSGGRMAAM